MNAPSPDTIVQPWSPAQAAHLAHVQAATAWRGTLHPRPLHPVERPRLRRPILWPAIAATLAFCGILAKAVAG